MLVRLLAQAVIATAATLANSSARTDMEKGAGAITLELLGRSAQLLLSINH
jgi:hypothetical protein